MCDISVFSFPSNVNVMCNPHRDLVCSEYYQFAPLTGHGMLDVWTMPVQLNKFSLVLYRMGGNRINIEHMFRHFVAY